MGIIKNLVGSAAKEAAKDIGRDAALSVLDAANTATEKASNVAGKVAKIADKATRKIIEANNNSRLKKEARKEDHYLFVQKEVDLEKGIYKVVDNKKKEKYSTIKENLTTLNVYEGVKGKIATVKINKNTTNKLFSKSKTEIKYLIEINSETKELTLSIVDMKIEAKSSIGNWMFAGDLLNSNYKILNVDDGKELATITKKNKTASAYLVSCQYDRNESTIIIFSILIDLAKAI